MKLQNHENVVIKADPIGFCLYDVIRQNKLRLPRKILSNNNL